MYAAFPGSLHPKSRKFSITDGKVFQKITHRQEQPEYEKSVAILANEEAVIIKKVFVIDDVIYCTMLLAEEY